MKYIILFLILSTSIIFSQSIVIISDSEADLKSVDLNNFASAKLESCNLLLELGSGEDLNFEFRSNGKDTFTTISYGEYVLERVHPCPPFCSGEVYTEKEAEELFGHVIGKSVMMKVDVFKKYLSQCDEVLKFRILE